MTFRLFPFLSPDAEPNENTANNFSTNISDEISSNSENSQPIMEEILPEIPQIDEPIVEIPEINFSKEVLVSAEETLPEVPQIDEQIVEIPEIIASNEADAEVEEIESADIEIPQIEEPIEEIPEIIFSGEVPVSVEETAEKHSENATEVAVSEVKNTANNLPAPVSNEIDGNGEKTPPVNEEILPEIPQIEEPIVEIPEIIFSEEVPVSVEERTSKHKENLAEAEITDIQEIEEEPEPLEASAEISAKEEEIPSAVETDNAPFEKEGSITEEIEHHDELAPQIAFNELSRIELVDLLKDAINEEALDTQKVRVQSIREAYYKVKEDEVTAKRSKFIENGGLAEAFEVIKDDTDNSFEAYVKQFQEKRTEIRKNKEKELLQNLKKKETILNELKQLMEKTDNISASFDRLHELQAEWRTIGLVPSANVDELWKIYHHHINNFYEIIKINKELRELDHKKNIELKTQLCVRAEELLMHDSITHSLEEYKGLQDQWKDIGQVAREVSETVWERFRAAGDKLFDRRREYIQGQESEHKENLSKKIAICERADVLVNELPLKAHQHWQEASEKLAAMLEDWKLVGFASRKDNEDIWKRFKAARDKFYESKEEFYKSLRDTQNHNYKLKVDLCMEAEALKESDDWKKTGDKIRELQEQWKNSGPVAKKHSDKLWIRFRSACDVFFENRNKHFAGMNDEQGTNLEKKKDLIARIEAFVHAEDGNANFETLKSFQNEWMEIGHVPIKEKEKIQKAYRTAIDKQFDTLKATNAEGKRQNFRAQVSHFTSAPGGKDKLNHQKTTVQEKIKRLQSEVQTLENNIGFFANAKSKAADDMRRDIEKKISKAKEEITSLHDQLKILKEPS